MGFPSPLKVWVKGGIKRDMIDAIRNNHMLNEIIVKNESSSNEIGRVVDTDMKFGIRLYNLARTLDMFFAQVLSNNKRYAKGPDL